MAIRQQNPYTFQDLPEEHPPNLSTASRPVAVSQYTGILRISIMDHNERMCHAARCSYVLLLLCILSCVYALPRQNNLNYAPLSKVQFTANFASARTDNSSLDEVSYVDFDPSPIPSKRPNICNDCVCGVSRKAKIVGGNITNIQEYPWLVSLSQFGEFFCAGSLITRRHILTAAHCLQRFDPSYIKIVLADERGPRTGKSNGIVRHIKSQKIHQDYNGYSFNNDIAIIELDHPVAMDGVVRSACLPEDKAIDYTGTTATVVGWGRTGENEHLSDELRKVDLPILSEEECLSAGYPKQKITENMFCAGYIQGERDACRGDSGGPLHVRGSSGHLEVVGIVSWGRGCARPNFPGLYTKLNNYLGWLKDNLNGECVCPPPNHF